MSRPGVQERVHDRVRDDVHRLVHRGLPVRQFALDVGEAVSRAVPAEGTCLMTTDPATLLPIFTKSGAGSRGEFTARLFLDHYATSLTSAPVETGATSRAGPRGLFGIDEAV